MQGAFYQRDRFIDSEIVVDLLPKHFHSLFDLCGLVIERLELWREVRIDDVIVLPRFSDVNTFLKHLLELAEFNERGLELLDHLYAKLVAVVDASVIQEPDERLQSVNHVVDFHAVD